MFREQEIPRDHQDKRKIPKNYITCYLFEMSKLSFVCLLLFFFMTRTHNY